MANYTILDSVYEMMFMVLFRSSRCWRSAATTVLVHCAQL